MMSVGVGLVGSISGTVAWYQYSTRVTTSFMGNSTKCSENLQISLDGTNFKSELIKSEIAAAAKANKKGSNFQPVTPGALTTSGVGNMYGHPMYQNFDYSTWQAAPANSYLQYDLWFRVLDVNGNSTEKSQAIKGVIKPTFPQPVPKGQYLTFYVQAEENINNNLSLDLVCLDIKQAWDYLGKITGETSTEEIVDRIFEKFCLGK